MPSKNRNTMIAAIKHLPYTGKIGDKGDNRHKRQAHREITQEPLFGQSRQESIGHKNSPQAGRLHLDALTLDAKILFRLLPTHRASESARRFQYRQSESRGTVAGAQRLAERD